MTERTVEPAADAEDDSLVHSADAAAASVDSSPSPDQNAQTELPTRAVSDLPPRRSIRRMDDPEVLERVLAGLLELP
jgi:hypothetical protein